ncbi:MAG TPA: hypothetical protein VGB99_01630, partial [Acidobacteriota bacterium]
MPSAAQEQGIGFDAATSADTGTATAASLTFSHTVGATGVDRLLIVGVSIRNSGSQTVSSVTYGGVGLTQVGAISNSNKARVEIWRLVAPATGANDVEVTMSAAARFVAGAASFTDVDQSAPLGAFSSNTGSSTTPTVDLSGLLEGEVVIDTIANENLATGNPLPIAGAGQTERWNDRTTSSSAGENTPGAGSTEPAPAAGGSINMSWTLEASRNWAIGAVVLKPTNPANGISVNGVSSTTGDTASLTFSHTVGSSTNRILIVGTAHRDGTRTITGVTYGGAALTLIGEEVGPSTANRVTLWYLIAPPEGTANVVVSVSSKSKIVAGAVSYNNVHQTVPLGSFVSASGTSVTASVAASSADRELVVDIVGANGDAKSLTAAAEQAERWNVETGDAGGEINGGHSTKAGASSVTMSW